MWIFIPIDTGLRILQDSESRTILALKTDDAYADINPLIMKIRETLSGSRWGIYSWMSLNRSQQSNYQTTKVLLVLIMVLIVLVAVMNIASSNDHACYGNEQEIGILKGMGMNNRFLSLQYVMTAGLAGAKRQYSRNIRRVTDRAQIQPDHCFYGRCDKLCHLILVQHEGNGSYCPGFPA